jgi:hypothetical protein
VVGKNTENYPANRFLRSQVSIGDQISVSFLARVKPASPSEKLFPAGPNGRFAGGQQLLNWSHGFYPILVLHAGADFRRNTRLDKQ